MNLVSVEANFALFHLCKLYVCNKQQVFKNFSLYHQDRFWPLNNSLFFIIKNLLLYHKMILQLLLKKK